MQHKNIENQSGLSRVKLLLVEDDRAHAQLIKRAIKPIILDIHHVDNISDAFSYLENNNVDIILTDLNLVSSSGFELINKLGKSETLPIIVLTSSSNLDEAVRAMREGAWDFVTKRFTASFQAQLEVVLTRAWSRAEVKRREQIISSERNAFWTAVSMSEGGVAILNTSGEILFSNQSFKYFLKELESGFEKENEEDLSLVNLISLHDFSLSQEIFSQIFVRDDSLWTSEITLKKSDNLSSKHYNLRLSTIVDQDINSNSLTGSALSKYHILWTKDISEERIKNQRDRDILATTTHDLKGPLGAILTSTEMMMEDAEEDNNKTAEQMLNRVASCARTCINIVDELLSARTIHDGLLKINKDWNDLNSIVKDVYDEFIPVSKTKNISFTLIKSENAIPTLVDSVAIKRAFTNLVSNALKYTDSNGEVTIEVEHGVSGPVVRVSDNGGGIADGEEDRIFEMFSRMPEHSKLDGSGLGLYITKQIVDLHNGRIEVKSNQGSGSVFSISLPT